MRHLVDGLDPMPMGSSVTVEPGGQVELSTPPGDDAVLAIAALGLDREALRTQLADAGLGAAPPHDATNCAGPRYHLLRVRALRHGSTRPAGHGQSR